MELLGPAISLDTLVETLVIGVGTLSGVQRLELLCGFAVMSVVVNYIVFMTFYPACLSLIIDLSLSINNNPPVFKVHGGLVRSFYEENQKTNPVVQRVKIIMSTGLMIVHAQRLDLYQMYTNNKTYYFDFLYNNSRFAVPDEDPNTTQTSVIHTPAEQVLPLNRTEPSELSEAFMKWLTMSADQIVILILVVALLVKFIFFEDREELADQLKERMSSASLLTVENKQTQSENKTETTSQNMDSHKKIFTLDDDSSQYSDVETQTDGDLYQILSKLQIRNAQNEEAQKPNRSLEECVKILNSDEGACLLTDNEIKMIVKLGGNACPLYKIESVINDPERGVKIRREIFASQANVNLKTLDELSYNNFDYTKVMNACCENVLGYVQIPVGYAGPLRLDETQYYVPMATTEGALVASTNRGCKAISISGVRSFVEDVGMTRAPCVKFPCIYRAALAKRWMEAADNFEKLKVAFDSTSRFARLQELFISIDGPQLYIRFRALTGDAMGMNMVSKGAEMALRVVETVFPDMQIISLSGNFCSDKKPAAINWIKGRGKRVVCETIIRKNDLERILKTTAGILVQCNKLKNMAGSAMAGSIGGNNAHAANMVTAIFIATGQDPAQNVTSSNCSTSMDLCGDDNEDLYMTCTMPSLEVGTVGGGTGLPGQSACLEILGVKGAHKTVAGDNARTLAKIICATVMAGELSLMAALVNSDLVKSHMRHNRLVFYYLLINFLPGIKYFHFIFNQHN